MLTFSIQIRYSYKLWKEWGQWICPRFEFANHLVLFLCFISLLKWASWKSNHLRPTYLIALSRFDLIYSTHKCHFLVGKEVHNNYNTYCTAIVLDGAHVECLHQFWTWSKSNDIRLLLGLLYFDSSLFCQIQVKDGTWGPHMNGSS
jgi:hypothetical protein